MNRNANLNDALDGILAHPSTHLPLILALDELDNPTGRVFETFRQNLVDEIHQQLHTALLKIHPDSTPAIRQAQYKQIGRLYREKLSTPSDLLQFYQRALHLSEALGIPTEEWDRVSNFLSNRARLLFQPHLTQIRTNYDHRTRTFTISIPHSALEDDQTVPLQEVLDKVRTTIPSISFDYRINTGHTTTLFDTISLTPADPTTQPPPLDQYKLVANALVKATEETIDAHRPRTASTNRTSTPRPHPGTNNPPLALFTPGTPLRDALLILDEIPQPWTDAVWHTVDKAFETPLIWYRNQHRPHRDTPAERRLDQLYSAPFKRTPAAAIQRMDEILATLSSANIQPPDSALTVSKELAAHAHATFAHPDNPLITHTQPHPTITTYKAPIQQKQRERVLAQIKRRVAEANRSGLDNSLHTRQDGLVMSITLIDNLQPSIRAFSHIQRYRQQLHEGILQILQQANPTATIKDF